MTEHAGTIKEIKGVRALYVAGQKEPTVTPFQPGPLLDEYQRMAGMVDRLRAAVTKRPDGQPSQAQRVEMHALFCLRGRMLRRAEEGEL